MNGWRIPNLMPIFYLAIFGIICGAVLTIACLGFGIWFVVNHVQIVW